MEIESPKVAHSLGELLIEIGTITLGILIALAAFGSDPQQLSPSETNAAIGDLRVVLSSQQTVAMNGTSLLKAHDAVLGEPR